MPLYSNKDYVKIIRPLPKYVQKDIYGIPFIETDIIDTSKINNGLYFINSNNCSLHDTHSHEKIVHGFGYDDKLNRIYNNPFQFLEKIHNYDIICTLDFSMDDKMSFPQILNATFKSRWFGAFLQTNGKKVMPTVGWLSKEYFDITFAGLRDGSSMIISTIGANNPKGKEMFLSGYIELRHRFPSSVLVCIGDKIEGMDDDVCYVKYEESFGYHNSFQLQLFNWDYSVPDWR